MVCAMCAQGKTGDVHGMCHVRSRKDRGYTWYVPCALKERQGIYMVCAMCAQGKTGDIHGMCHVRSRKDRHYLVTLKVKTEGKHENLPLTQS